MQNMPSSRKPSVSSMDRTTRQDKTFGVTVRSTFSKNQSTMSGKNVPMYVNVTGPGDYEIPSFVQRDFTEADSRKRAAPCFTIAPKTK